MIQWTLSIASPEGTLYDIVRARVVLHMCMWKEDKAIVSVCLSCFHADHSGKIPSFVSHSNAPFILITMVKIPASYLIQMLHLLYLCI